jgi:hypothetical protein
MAVSPRSDLFGRVVGILVFLVGLGVILAVVWLGFGMFRDPNLGMQPAANSPSPSAADLGVGFGKLIMRIALLFLGSICGSLIANKGIQLYFSALQGRLDAPNPEKSVRPPSESA